MRRPGRISSPVASPEHKKTAPATAEAVSLNMVQRGILLSGFRKRVGHFSERFSQDVCLNSGLWVVLRATFL